MPLCKVSFYLLFRITILRQTQFSILCHIWQRNWGHIWGEKLQEVQLVLQHPQRPSCHLACNDKVTVTILYITLVWHMDIFCLGNHLPCVPLHYILECLTHFSSLSMICYQKWIIFFIHNHLNTVLGWLYFHLSFIPFQVTDISFLVYFQLLLHCTIPMGWFHTLMYITCGMSWKLLIYSLQEASEGYGIDRFLWPHHH